jgi:hypothetical protein
MKRFLGVALLAILTALGGTTAFACGDKLLAIGRGLRFQRASAAREANLLIYSRSGVTLTGAKLQNTLRQSVHKLELVKDGAQLDGALRAGRVDVVLVAFADLSAIAQQLHSAPSQPVILPVLIHPSKADLAAARKEYKFALSAGADESEYLLAVDEAMRLRLKTAAKA